MTKLIIAFILGCLVVGSAWAAEKTFTLRPIEDIAVDAPQCFKDGGRGALVGDLNEEGSIVSAWEAVCVLEVK